jgi:HPt (histidine-containing phosphotransfer) domain-containing protein
VNDYTDLERIGELEDVMGADASAIVSSMLESMTVAIDEVEQAMAAGQLDRATRAAHRCRNDALMLGARQLLAALTDLEAAARETNEAEAGAALERVRRVWPPTRDELVAGANPP